jgi:di/tricarboxylate transporter
METLTTDMLLALGILFLALGLFVSELIRMDVAALSILVLLGLTELVPGSELFSGFASDAVIAIIAVMIIGAGLDRTGAMGKIASLISRYGGNSERRVLALICAACGALSSFMQNVAATALFLPVASRVASRANLPLRRLLMPLSFCALLGGTITLVGSSPLIVLNDLIRASNRSLPGDVTAMREFQLFSVAPIGIALLLAGIVFFATVGRKLLPRGDEKAQARGGTRNYFAEIYGIRGDFFEVLVTVDSDLVGMTVGDVEKIHGAPLLVGLRSNDEARLAPPRDEMIWVGSTLGLIGPRDGVEQFCNDNELRIQPRQRHFGRLVNPALAGISEVVIPPGSRFIGRTVGEERMRKAYGLAVLAINRGNDIIKDEVRETPLQAGDCLVIHSSWKNLGALAENRNFAIISEVPKEEQRPQKVRFALTFFAISLGLILFTELSLPLALMAGALGMVLTGVIDIDDAYRAVSWKTVFLVASLIPLGYALDATGTAQWMAQGLVGTFSGAPVWMVQLALALLATGFGLVISNIGATILLVPLAINVAITVGGDPRAFALLVALVASNNFLIATNQATALVVSPGNYSTKEFLRLGAPLTLIYIAVVMVMINLLF